MSLRYCLLPLLQGIVKILFFCMCPPKKYAFFNVIEPVHIEIEMIVKKQQQKKQFFAK